MKHLQEFEQSSIPKLLLKFTLPAVVGLIVLAIYNMVDRIFVGQGVGALGLTGLTMCFPIMMLQMGVGVLIGAGGAALMSLYLGEKKKDVAERVLGNMAFLVILCSGTITIVGVTFAKPILQFFQTSPEAMPYALPYLTIVFAGTFAVHAQFCTSMSIRSQGNPKIAMYLMIFGTVTNMILDPIFIWGFHMGTAGAAIATVIAQLLAAIFGLALHFTPHCVLKIRLRSCLPDRKLILKIAMIGFSPFIMNVATSLQNSILNFQLRLYGGDMAVAAIGIIFSVMTIVLMINIGISDGLQPIIGYNYGAKQYKRVKQALALACSAAFLITLVEAIIIESFPTFFVRLFCSNNPELLKMASHGLRIFLMCFPVAAIQIIGTRYFQAVGKAGIATFNSLLRPILLFIPLLFLFAGQWGLSGIWMVGPVSDFLAMLVTSIWLLLEIRHLDQQHILASQPSMVGAR